MLNVKGNVIARREYKDADILLMVRYLNNPHVAEDLTSSVPLPYTKNDAARWVSTTNKNSLIRVIEFNGTSVGKIGFLKGDSSEAVTLR